MVGNPYKCQVIVVGLEKGHKLSFEISGLQSVYVDLLAFVYALFPLVIPFALILF